MSKKKPRSILRPPRLGLTSREAAILALVVENPRMNEERYRKLRSHVEDRQIRELLDVYRADGKGEDLGERKIRYAAQLDAMSAWCAANTGRRSLADPATVN